MKRRKSKNAKPQIRLVGWDAPVKAAVMVAGLASGATLAAPGDLDPSFGQVGRRSDIDIPWISSLRSIEVREDDSILFGGGGEYDYYSYMDDFLGGLLPSGATDAGFAAAAIENAAVYDTALQADGKAVAVGTVLRPDGSKKLMLYRLLPNGAIDASFGLNGVVVISDGTPGREAGYSVIVDPAGKIVVAGGRSSSLLVARTEPNGTLDASFGTGGIFVGPEALSDTMRIANAPAGGYRLIAMVPYGGMGWDCNVIGLTAAGALDTTFGTGGYAALPGSAGDHTCASLLVQTDGRTVVGGQAGEQGFAYRLLASGAHDTAFDGSSVPTSLRNVAALGLGANGKVIVTGTDREDGASARVLRLLANGAPDTQYGSGGAAIVDPELRNGGAFLVTDLKVGRNDAVVLGGTSYSWPDGATGVVARLIGDTGGSGPGVFSFKQRRLLSTEAAGQAVLAVRRTGGSAGAVAVTYDTRSVSGASPTDDYTPTTGRLTWVDGDTGEREIIVPIAPDSKIERPELFEVVLLSPEGGAGLGFHGAEVEIAGSSYPHGDFSIWPPGTSVREGETAFIYVSREYYSQGEVSVTLRLASGGTATAGEDFRNSGSTWQDVVLTWADGEMGQKSVQVQTVVDSSVEATELFTLELVAPTGGALIGTSAQALVQINGQTTPPPNNPDRPNSRSGGGTFGALGALLLGCCGMLRRFVPRLQAARRRA